MSSKLVSSGRKVLQLTECNARLKWKITQPDLKKLRRLRRRMDDAIVAYKDFERELLDRLEIWSPVQSGPLDIKLRGGIDVEVSGGSNMHVRPPGRDPHSGRFTYEPFSDQDDPQED
jgi:hypothetical protein